MYEQAGQLGAAGAAAFQAPSQYVRNEDIASSTPCGDSVDAVVQAVKGLAEAGFTHVGLCQMSGVGPDRRRHRGRLHPQGKELGPALAA